MPTIMPEMFVTAGGKPGICDAKPAIVSSVVPKPEKNLRIFAPLILNNDEKKLFIVLIVNDFCFGVSSTDFSP